MWTDTGGEEKRVLYREDTRGHVEKMEKQCRGMAKINVADPLPGCGIYARVKGDILVSFRVTVDDKSSDLRLSERVQ